MRDDPDDYRDGSICDDVPEAHWAGGYELPRPSRPTPEAEAARLRERVVRLCGRLSEGECVTPREAAETSRVALTTSDVAELRVMCALLERRVGLMLGTIA